MKILSFYPACCLPRTLSNWKLLTSAELLRMAWRLARYAATVLCGSALLLIALPACADVWGYTDAKGVARFSAEKMDERYVPRYGNKIPPFKQTQNYVVTVMQIYTLLEPPAMIAQRQIRLSFIQQPSRVRMESTNMPASNVFGQIARRGNLVSPLSTPYAVPDIHSSAVGTPVATTVAASATASNAAQSRTK
jgi:hypothetical protein